MVKKILVSYKVDNAQGNYKPGMNVSGKIWVESQEDKEMTLKAVNVRFRESWEQYATQKSGNTKTSGWFPRAKAKKGFPVAEKEIIAPGETKEYDFSYDIPEFSPRIKKNIRNWWVGLFFLIKTGIVSSMGARPVDAFFLLPCDGSEAPLSVIQGMVMGSQSMIGGEDSGDYADSLVDIAAPQAEKNKGPGLDEWLKGIIPSDDSIQKIYGNVQIQEDKGMGMSSKWYTPVIATRYGMALIIPRGDDQAYNFWPWTKLNKVTKGSMTGGGSSNLKGHIQVKRGRKTTKMGFLLSVFKGLGEDRALFKARKKDFQVEFPQFFKAAMANMLDADEVAVMKSAAGEFDFDSSEPDLFPGFNSGSSNVSFDDDPGPATFPGDPIAADDDDDWMEESPLENVPSSVSPPESSEQDWDWDEFED